MNALLTNEDISGIADTFAEDAFLTLFNVFNGKRKSFDIYI